MSKQIQKSFQDCVSKIKNSNKQIQIPLRMCKRPKTTSFALANKGKENDGVTLSDIDEFLFENFRSLYLEEYEEEISKKNGATKTAPFALESPRLLDPPPPENLCSSARFFVSSGSSSSSLIDEACSSSSSAIGDSPVTSVEYSGEITADKSSAALAPDDFIALMTHSPSPYEDFRRSMEEMVEARVEHNGKVDWEFMEELLFCFLDLNNKKSYRFILRAFVDLIVVLRENSGTIPARAQPWDGGGGLRQLESEM